MKTFFVFQSQTLRFRLLYILLRCIHMSTHFLSVLSLGNRKHEHCTNESRIILTVCRLRTKRLSEFLPFSTFFRSLVCDERYTSKFQLHRSIDFFMVIIFSNCWLSLCLLRNMSIFRWLNVQELRYQRGEVRSPLFRINDPIQLITVKGELNNTR